MRDDTRARRALRFRTADDDVIVVQRGIELDGCRRRGVVEVHRDGIVERDAERDVAITPVFDERDIRTTVRSGFLKHLFFFTLARNSLVSIPRPFCIAK